ncbi:hypothetical protein [Streptomyces erythrochromogenes]|uniref:hypothetical protein n=1 Tax=Streptomyces erythrochromogenes TaxID=285574 RepID=UPI00368DE953
MRKRIIAAGLSGLALMGATVAAYAVGPLALQVGEGGGTCTISWTKSGITVSSPTPAPDVPAPSAAFTDASGQLILKGDPAQLITDPTALAAAVTLGVSAKGQISFTNTLGTRVDVSDPNAALPTGDVTFAVKSPANPNGIRMPAFRYTAPTKFSPELKQLLPLHATVKVEGLTLQMTPQFAEVLNTSFGPGTASDGDTFGACSGTFDAT